jgi:hypothetical protein
MLHIRIFSLIGRSTTACHKIPPQEAEPGPFSVPWHSPYSEIDRRAAGAARRVVFNVLGIEEFTQP